MLKVVSKRIEDSYEAYYGMTRLELFNIISKELEQSGAIFDSLPANAKGKGRHFGIKTQLADSVRIIEGANQ